MGATGASGGADEGTAGDGRRRGRGWHVIAFLWGAAEATVFFIVPDVLLSFLALRSPRLALAACASAAVGAVLGGVSVHALAVRAPGMALAVIDAVPWIGPQLIATIRAGYAADGWWALFRGPFIGEPYKVFALLAPELGYDRWSFAAASAPARGLRFVLIVLAVALVARLLACHLPWLHRPALLVLVRARIYTVYWSSLPEF
jgi:membrane protein YqaA with SNARE-associated domain